MIDVEHLVVSYGSWWSRKRFRALDGLDLQIREGDFFALLGQNGAGKSTLIHTVLGLLRPTSGRVRVLGQEPRLGHPMWSDLAYLPEEPLYHSYLTVEEAVTYYAALTRRDVPGAAVTEMLERLQLAEHRRLRIGSCSKGMKQKVGIAACLLHDPRLVILDEPMRGLDPAVVHLFRDLLLERNRRGTTVLMSSHVLSEVELVASQVGVMHRGRLVAQDHVSRLRSTSGAAYSVKWRGGAGDVPPQCTDLISMGDELQATIPAHLFFEWTEYARAKQLQVISCGLQGASLEESYLAILAREGQDA